ncbi:MAG TPA: acyl-CoA dehydrogenase family protein [Myxococcota bacterium]|nr:acyl-CoA dehydrogenase family protein [Myxococcota bacterium]
MDLRYGPEYEAFRDQVRRFLEAHRDDAPRAGIGRGANLSRERMIAWQRTLIEHGYAARTIPRAYGGYGAAPDLVQSIVIDEEFNRAGVSRGIAGQGISMLVPTLLEHGSEEQKRQYVGPTVRGELLWCQGYSEPGSGSDLASLQTRAVEHGDDFVINGQKIWTSTAREADMIFALVRTEPQAKKHEGISYLIFPMSTPGIEVRPLHTLTGNAEFNEVFFTDVRVPKSSLVGRRGEGWKIGNTTLRHERNMLGSSSQTEAMFASLVALMESEGVAGARAIDSPVLRDRLARLEASVLAMKYHALRLLTCQLRGEPPGVAGLIVKLRGCELNHQIAALALDALGELGPLYRDSPHLRAHGAWPAQWMFSLGLIIGGGTAQIQKNIIAERGLGLPREPKAA